MKKATTVMWLYEKMVWDYSHCGIDISTSCFWVYSKPDIPAGRYSRRNSRQQQWQQCRLIRSRLLRLRSEISLSIHRENPCIISPLIYLQAAQVCAVVRVPLSGRSFQLTQSQFLLRLWHLTFRHSFVLMGRNRQPTGVGRFIISRPIVPLEMSTVRT